MEQSTSQLVLCRSYTRDSATNLRCSSFTSFMCSYYQASVWNQAQSLYPDLPPVTETGWMQLDAGRSASSSIVYHRLIYSTQSVGAMLWSMAQLRRGQLRMVVDVVGSC